MLVGGLAGILLRALEPLEGIDTMQRSRGGASLRDLARGPGRLARAMQIDFSLDGLDLCAAGPLWLAMSRLTRPLSIPRRKQATSRVVITTLPPSEASAPFAVTVPTRSSGTGSFRPGAWT